jgi:NTE family protein
MIGLALSGGGSRAMAFHLGCLRALHDIGVLERVGVISTISGGSVIGAYYAYTPGKSFEVFEADMRGFLRTGFQWKIALELLRPLNLLRCVAGFAGTRAAEAWAVIAGKEPGFKRGFSRTDLFRLVLQKHVLPGLTMSSPRRNGVAVVIGACELRMGTAFRFGDSVSGDWRRGRLLEGDVDVALAVAASAAYPIFLPALDRTWKFAKDGAEKEHRVLLTDGGVYENLGFQVLEPGRDPKISLQKFPCEYLIACNAGYGQEAGDGVPLGFYRRVKRSFEVVHRRVQDSAMNRLHLLKETGAIKGFVLPYLGQIDERLPWKPSALVTRTEALGYPTDFAGMSDAWIKRLSNRGEQLTRCLMAQYCPELM